MIVIKNIFFKKPRTILIALGISAVCAIYLCIVAFSESKVDFNTDVRPIINNKCIACHGGVKQSAGFSLLYREEALGKTESGKKAIIPGNPDDSELMKRIITHDKDIRMPLEKDPLTDEEIAIFKKWIEQGAHWEEHWSFIKPKSITPPDYEDKEFVKNDIDKFIFEKLQEIDLAPSPQANKATLIRRVSLDLTGLPPTEKEVQAFINDKSTDAYEKAVNKLLASTAYGERWASMWLDLARFADTKGYEADRHRNIWRYRDYVIKSFNEDKPYDKFSIEQLAGDLLPNPSEDQIIATAFHRNTLSEDAGAADNEEYRTYAVIDRINTTFAAWQGLTMECVQCHTHPYDPIRHKEFYNFMDFFNSTKDNDLPEEAPTFISTKDFDEKKATEIAQYINELTGAKGGVPASFKAKRRKYLLPYLAAKDFDESFNIDFNHPTVRYLGLGSYIAFDSINLSGVNTFGCKYSSYTGGSLEVRLDKPDGPVLANLKFISTLQSFSETRSSISKPVKGFHKLYYILRPNEEGKGDVRLWELKLWQAEEKYQDADKKRRIDSLKHQMAKAINPEGTPVLQELTRKDRRTTNVFIRGSRLSKGEEVTGAVPQILNPFPKGAPKNRLGMAMWLTSKDNPLTARVAVNRFWEQLFGFGIVETLEDFGSQGIKPTHPELLDWMAVKFMHDYNWSMKKLLKLMVMSGTYRQSSIVTSEHLKKDERNKYLARGSRVRLTAEQIRDQALAVSGLLSPKMYGPSVMPHQPQGVWQSIYNGAEWQLSEGKDKYRRALYTYMKRTSPYPNMITFDAPNRNVSVARRIRTNTPLQALAMLNDTVSTIISVALAKRMIAEGGKDIKSRINKGYKIALAHDANPKTLNKLLEIYNKSNTYYQKNPGKAVKMAGAKDNAEEIASLSIIATAIINLDEFITKE
jgi:hypothetical protein